MKKVLVVLALLAPFAVMMAVELAPNVMAEADNPAFNPAITAMPDPETYELKYDEAVPVPFGFKMSTGDRLAVKMTPEEYPFDVNEACYVPLGWADDPDNWNEACYLVFFGDGAEPGTELGRKEVSALEAMAFNWFDVSDLGITITSGSFYFAVENKVDDNPGLALDGEDPENHVSWMYATFVGDDTPKWAEFDNIGLAPPWPEDMSLGDSCDAMLRVKGFGERTIDVIELGPGGVISITPLTTVTASASVINYSLPEASNVSISLWDAAGRHVETLYAGHSDAGEHTIAWDAVDLASGAYFIKLKTSYAVQTAKVVLID